MIGTPDERSGFHPQKTMAQGLVLQSGRTPREYNSGDTGRLRASGCRYWPMVSRSVPRRRSSRKSSPDLGEALAQADHQAGLGDPAPLLAVLQDAQRIRESRGPAVDPGIQRRAPFPRCGPGRRARRPAPCPAGRRARRNRAPAPRSSFAAGRVFKVRMTRAKWPLPLSGKVVAGNRRDDRVAQVHQVGHLDQLAPLVGIQRQRRAGGDGAKAAVAVQTSPMIRKVAWSLFQHSWALGHLALWQMVCSPLFSSLLFRAK